MALYSPPEPRPLSLVSDAALSPTVNDYNLNRVRLISLDTGLKSGQIIDDEQRFTRNLDGQIKRWRLEDTGSSYRIVSIMGSQSSGKSTLLNYLFGTDFTVMDETRRRQTTKGIWMCPGKFMDVLVMDVEGDDCRERTGHQDFACKSALYSLVLSDVLIINIWENQIGLYNAANKVLLRAVLEHPLARDSIRTHTLLFVIRDYIGATPLKNLKETLTADLAEIWNSIQKPPELQHRQLSDYFALDFTALPHKVHAAHQFQADVQRLRMRFTDKEKEGYIFKPMRHENISTAELPIYMRLIWEEHVCKHEDFELLAPQEMVAYFRCDEIFSATLAEFEDRAGEQKRLIDAGQVVDGLGGLLTSLTSDALNQYDRDASSFHRGIYQRKRAHLLDAFESTCSPLFVGQLRNLRKSCLMAFEDEITDVTRSCEFNFVDFASKARDRCEDRFKESVEEAWVEGTGWSWEDELAALKEDLSNITERVRKNAIMEIATVVERRLDGRISASVDDYLNEPIPHMWVSVLQTFKDACREAETTYLEKIKGFNFTEEQNIAFILNMRMRTWQGLRSTVCDKPDAVILEKLRNDFKRHFLSDEHGNPRVWTLFDDIDDAFEKAKSQSLDRIACYSKVPAWDSSLMFTLLDDFDFDIPATTVNLTSHEISRLKSLFQNDAYIYYLAVETSSGHRLVKYLFAVYGMCLIVYILNVVLHPLSSVLDSLKSVLGALSYAPWYALYGSLCALGWMLGLI